MNPDKVAGLLRAVDAIQPNKDNVLTPEPIVETKEAFIKDIRPGRGLMGNELEGEELASKGKSISFALC